ncbi:MAG: molybdopterin-dependent oxidoreductase [Sphingomonadales bacterium]
MMQTHSFTQGPGEYASFCRICTAGCGTRLTVDEQGHIVRIVGDDQNELSSGYACFKGLQSGLAHRDPQRVVRPLKRQADGSFVEIPMEQALDEIAARIDELMAESGPNAIALFAGNGSMMNQTAVGMNRHFLHAIGSEQYFTTVTIDQSGKMVAAGRMGGWAAGAVDLDEMDVLMLFGVNPFIAHSTMSVLGIDPVKRLKRARQRGLKLIVVDPRRTETAVHADLAFQPYPGEDATIAAGLIHLILAEGWHDAAFCERYVGAERLAMLKEAVSPFTPEIAERRAGLEPGSLRSIADLFARQNKRGQALTGTGPNMSQYSNLAVHMVQLLNVICGRFPREGQRISYVDMLNPPKEVYAEVVPASRPWEKFPASRIRGAGNFFGERVSGTLTDEILTPGADRIRALIVDGANPMTSLPDRDKTHKAMQALDLLVVIDTWETPTTQHAHYILPTKMQYERPDMSPGHPALKFYPGAWAQFTPAIVAPPEGAEVVDDWYVFWALAKRLGVTINFSGLRAMTGDEPPTTEDLIAILLERSQTSLDELSGYPHGRQFPMEGGAIKPPRPEHNAQFDVMPADVLDELRRYMDEPVARKRAGTGREFTHLLSTRRMRDMYNSYGILMPTVRKRNKYNPAYLHSDDLAELGIEPGTLVEIVSAHGRTQAILELDDTMRRGVVALSQGWGGTPGKENIMVDGSCVNALIDTDTHYENINAMPHMTAVPVRFVPVPQSELAS